MHKIITSSLMGCLLLGAAPSAFGAQHGLMPHSTVSKEKITPGGEITAGGKTFKVGFPQSKGRMAKKKADSSGIIDNPSGTPQEYSKTSGGYYYYGSYASYMDAGQAATIYWDGNEAFIYNILSYKETYSYVLGEREGDRLVVPMNQTVASAEFFDINLGLLHTVIGVAPNPNWEEGDDEDERYINFIDFEYNEDYDEAVYAIGSDGTLTLQLPEYKGALKPDEDGITYLDPADYGFPDYALGFYYTDDLLWTGDCDIYQIYEEFNYPQVEEPAGLEYEYFSYINDYDLGVLVNVARAGDVLYFKGLSAYAPEAVFKANLVQTEAGLVASVPQNQFIGRDRDGYYNLLTRTLVYDSSARDYVLAPENVDATFFVTTDPATGKIIAITSNSAVNTLVFNYAGDYYDPYDEFPDINLKYQATLDGTPRAPEGIYFEDHTDFIGGLYLFFYLSQISEEGNILDVDNLYYRVFVNGEPYEFMQHDGVNLRGDFITIYNGITSPTTLIPYTFYNGVDIFSDEFHLYYVGFYNRDISSIGAQSVYVFGDDVKYSEIVYADLSKVDEISAGEVVAVEYFDLGGRRIENPAEGIFIVRTVLSDGTVKVSKTVRTR